MRISAGKLAELYKKCKRNPVVFESEIRQLCGFSQDDDGFNIVTGPHNAGFVPAGDERLRPPLLSAKSTSILDVGEAICGKETLRTLWDRPYGMRGGRALTVGEEVGGGALGPTQFADINAWFGATDGLLGATMLEKYQYAVKLAKEIVSWEMDVRFQDNKSLHYALPTAPTEDLQPGEELPSADLTTNWIRNARMIK